MDRQRAFLALAWVVAVTVAFAWPLAALVQHAVQYDLHSHIPLIPLVSAYLLATSPALRRVPAGRSVGGAAAAALVGASALWAALWWRGTLGVNDHLSLMTAAWLAFVVAGGFLFLGRRWMAAAAFPVGFLVFMLPLPDGLVAWLERALVLGSAEVSALFFNLAGTPHVRTGQVFELPGIAIEVARECSGIRSSWALFITSVLAAHLFLRTTWRRVLLVAFVIPLGIVRNGFRILVLGLLSVHVGPHMLDSVIHRRGGPLFFLLSLAPLFLLLWWLRRGERRP